MESRIKSIVHSTVQFQSPGFVPIPRYAYVPKALPVKDLHNCLGYLHFTSRNGFLKSPRWRTGSRASCAYGSGEKSVFLRAPSVSLGLPTLLFSNN